MFNQFEPNVKATIAFLKMQNVKVTDTTVNDTLQNHPDWPSLLCITDSLTKWGIPNGAGKIEPNLIDELPVPFIATINNAEYPLAIVEEVSEHTIKYFNENYAKAKTENKAAFLKKWYGVYLITEPNEHSGEKDYTKNKRKSFINGLLPTFLLGIIFILSFLFLKKNISAVSLANMEGIYIQYFITVAGVIVSSLLLWYDIDKSNPLLQKVCTGIAKGNCNAILTGTQSKLFSWLSWSEVGFFYFTGGLLSLVLLAQQNALTLIAWFNILALPYTVFSVYYQWRVAKQWCVLCLAVQGLFVLGAANIFANKLLTSLFAIPISYYLNIFLFYILPVLVWFTIKQYLLKLQESKNTKREYLRIKFNAEIFETLLKKQKAITQNTESIGISLGNPNATNTLIKVCNPYCGPCAQAHPEIETLLENNKDLQVKIIFTTPNKPEQAAYKPVSHLLAIEEQAKSEAVMKRALDDWYLANNKDYETFAKKYPMNGELKQQGRKIASMEKWCTQMNIQYTPTIFINGYQLPDAYSIADVEYFLLE